MAGLQGRALGGFQLGEQLNGGGISDVYRGRPVKGAGRDVVIKVIYPEFAQQPGFQSRFRQIVQLSGRLANHPHILPLVASGEEGGYLYLITPFVAGGTLKDWLASGKRFGSADVAPFFRQLCDAVTYAHSLGIAHGNLKPSNIFLFEGRHVLLGDFGTLLDLRQMDLNLAGSGTEAFEYLAPEAANGQATQAGDIYSIGALLFATLTGQAPFRAATPNAVIAAHARQPAPHLAQASPLVAPPVLALDPVIQRALAKRPEDRFPSATSLAQAIESVARQVVTTGGQQLAMQAAAAFASGPMPPQGAYPPNSGGFAPGSASFPPLAAAAAAYHGSAGMQLGAAGGAPPQGFASGPVGLPAPSLPLGQVATSLAQVSNAFPPLPANATIDAQMDQGRVDSVHSDIPFQPTARVAAPARAISAPPRVAPPRVALGSPGEPASPPIDDGWQRAAADGDSAAGPQELPAIRRPRSAPSGIRRKSGGGTQSGPPPSQGFLVAGGSAPSAGAQDGGAGSTSFEDAPLGDDRFDPPGARTFSNPIGRDSEMLSAEAIAVSMESLAQPEWRLDPSQYSSGPQTGEYQAAGQDWRGQYSAELAAPHSAELYTNGRPYSATQLGLPRLTAPALEGMPPSWNELASDGSRISGAPAPSTRDGWHEATGTSWAVPAETGTAGAWAMGESAGWPAPRDGWSGAPMPSGRMAGAVMDPVWGQGRAADGTQVGTERRSEKKSWRKAKQQPADSGFDDDRIWTVGLTAVRRKNRRWVRRLTLLLVLVLLVDMVALVVARPDLCPTSGCRDLNVLIHQKLPMLSPPTAPAVSPVKATPSAVTLTSAASKSASAKLTVKNTTAGPISLQAAAGLSWLSVSPASVPLAPGGSAQVTVTAKPASAGIKPGNYTSGITLTAGDSSLTVPVTVVVTAG